MENRNQQKNSTTVPSEAIARNPIPPEDSGRAGSLVSLERGGKPTRAVLTASIRDADR
jgi:hypothetical protein